MERVRIERRRLLPRAPIVVHLPLPPARGARAQAFEAWREAAEAAIRRSPSRRMLCPVEVLMVFREGRVSVIADLPAACLCVLAESGLITSLDSRNVRQWSVRFGDVRGVEIEIREAPRHG